MHRFRIIARPVAIISILCFLSLGISLPAARAEMIGTESVINAQRLEQHRDRLIELLQREEVRTALIVRGVDPLEAQARVAGLTDAEVQSLANDIDQLPAGGGALGLAVLVFLVLLLTDILGYTDIFPFVKKPAEKR
jgi:hypothetical protein